MPEIRDKNLTWNKAWLVLFQVSCWSIHVLSLLDRNVDSISDKPCIPPLLQGYVLILRYLWENDKLFEEDNFLYKSRTLIQENSWLFLRRLTRPGTWNTFHMLLVIYLLLCNIFIQKCSLPVEELRNNN